MTVQEAIQEVVAGRDLSAEAAHCAASAIISGEATPAQIGGLLIAIRMKGEAVSELLGFVEAMREKMTPLPVAIDGLVDTCGTGGDGAGTFNISTAAAFVAAAAGCRIAKHGNRAISSRCGSADVLLELGLPIDAAPELTAQCIERFGLGFMFAPQYHPSLKHAAGPRRELGVRSILNVVGPLVNPASVRRQLIGVYDGHLTEPVARVAQRLGCDHCLVVHGADGLDEITLTTETHITEVRGSDIRSYTIEPEQFGLRRASANAVHGGDATTNARILLDVLSGIDGPARDVVLINAGAVIYVSGTAASLREGIDRAAEAVKSGAAREKLQAVREFLRENSP